MSWKTTEIVNVRFILKHLGFSYLHHLVENNWNKSKYSIRHFVYLISAILFSDDKTIFYGIGDSDLLKSGEEPQFKWLRDGQPFQPEERFKVDYKVK